MSIIKEGWRAVKSDTRLWIICLLIFVFPALFIFYAISEANYIEANLNTVLRQKVSTLHDSIEAIIRSGAAIDASLAYLSDKQDDVRKLLIVQEQAGVFTVQYDSFGGELGRVVDETDSFSVAKIQPGTSYIFPYHIGDSFLEQAFRHIPLDDASLYIFTEHDFTSYYNLFSNRATRSQFVLLLICSFLIFMAYWIARQRNYEVLHRDLLVTMQERDIFTNSLVHELRAPLTAMRGYASMIEEAPTTPDTERGYALRIKESTTRLVTLVNDFLEAARIQAGKLPLSIAEVDLDEVLDRVVAAALPNAQSKGLVVNKAWNSTNLAVTSDEKRIEQVLTNLLSNAIKYTPQGTVTVTAKEQLGRVIIEISDTGPGISAEDQKKLFAPFVRVGSAEQNRTVTGSGLGMWITKQLAEQLGGTISLESIQGVGTHVYVSLPREYARRP